MLTTESTPEPGGWRPAIEPPDPDPVPVTFLGPDQGAVAGRVRLPFVRGATGRVGWVAEGLRLVPRADSE
jgi:hypothetical protein